MLARAPACQSFGTLGDVKDILLNFGAIAGFAGIIGLAVLAMLYFSQARDVRRLREWAGREPERAAEVELRAQQIASQAIAQAYESMAYRQEEASAAAGIAQAAGIEVAPPPPAESPPEQTVEQPVEHTEEGQPAEEHDPQATQAHDVLSDQVEDELPPLEPLPPDEAAHSVAAATSAPEASVSQPAPDAPEPPSDQNLLTPSTPAAARAATPLPPLPPLDTSEFTAVRTPSSPPIPDYYLSTGTTGSGHYEAIDPPTGHRSRVPFAVAGVLVAVFAVILISTQLLGGNDDASTQKGTGGSATNRPADNTSNNRNQRINRAAVTVAVLNGTDTAGIAATAASGLGKAGFSDTTTGNLSDGVVHPTSTVYYASGSKAEAQEVAKELAVTDVKPATDAVLAKGGSVPVIVVLGADFQQ